MPRGYRSVPQRVSPQGDERLSHDRQERRRMNERGAISPVAAMATMGAILVALGVAWVFISNWHQFGTSGKILVLLGVTSASFFAAYLLEQRGYDKTGQAVYLLTSLLWTLSIFIIAQQFHYGLSVQENANLLFAATLGPTTIAYLMRSGASLYLSLVMFAGWAVLQPAAYGLDFQRGTFQFGFSPMMVFLGIALFYFGLGLYHRGRGYRDFAMVYTWSASGVILLLGFLYSAQSYQPVLAIPLKGLWSWYSLFFIVVPAAMTVIGIRSVLAKRNISPFDAYSGLIVWGMYVLSAILLPLALETSRHAMSLPAWAGTSLWKMGPAFIIQWLYFNAVFITLVLYIIDFSAREHRVALLNLALNTFGLYILVRYVGFMVDLQGYLPLSMMLILGGIGLIGLSMAYHNFRKRTKEKAA